MKSIRAFFALSLPKPVQDTLEKILVLLQESMPTKHRVNWIPLSKLHITLQFLRSIQLEHIPQLVENVQLQLKELPAFELEFGSLELFPSSHHPRIISLQVGPHDALNLLATAIGQGITATNYSVETRPFRGHLTLGRLRHFNPQHYQLEQIKLPPIPTALIADICLFESKLSKESSSYIPLAHIGLVKN